MDKEDKAVEKIFVEHLSAVAQLAPSTLAIKAGLAPSTLNRHTKDKVDVKHKLGMDSLRKIGDYLGIPIPRLISHREEILKAVKNNQKPPGIENLGRIILRHDVGRENSLQTPNISSRVPHRFGPDRIPLFGLPIGSKNILMLTPQYQIGTTFRHPEQEGVNDAYCMEMPDESMAPRYNRGERIWFNLNHMALEGHDCIVELNDGSIYPRIFKTLNSKEIICRQLNPDKEWKCSLSEVKAVHAVVR